TCSVTGCATCSTRGCVRDTTACCPSAASSSGKRRGAGVWHRGCPGAEERDEEQLVRGRLGLAQAIRGDGQPQLGVGRLGGTAPACGWLASACYVRPPTSPAPPSPAPEPPWRCRRRARCAPARRRARNKPTPPNDRSRGRSCLCRRSPTP